MASYFKFYNYILVYTKGEEFVDVSIAFQKKVKDKGRPRTGLRRPSSVLEA
jgi:hypothetical protein